MKNTMKCLAIIFVAVIGFSMIACDDDWGGGGGDTHNSKTYTYTGTVNSVTYTLKIDGCTCVGLTPRIGDNYTLTVGGKTSTGVVTSFKAGVLILEPVNSTTTFTTTVSGTFITAMSGTITWIDNTTDLAPAGPWVISPSHTHQGGAWQYNATQHWRLCTICGDEYGRANHTFTSSTCTVCGYSGGNPVGPTNWVRITNHPFGASGIKAVAYGNGRWVAGGGQGKMAYSTDNGVTWTAVLDSTFGTSVINAVAFGGGTWVAGGGNPSKMAYSTDNGVTWTAVSNTTFTGQYNTVDAIAYGTDKFVAGDRDGRMAYSTDNGVTWTAAGTIDPPMLIISNIAYGSAGNVGGRFVVVGGDASRGRIAYSDDGINWTPVSDTAIDQISGVAYGSGRWVALGSGKEVGMGDTAYSTDNGVTWIAVIHEALGGSTNSVIGYGNGMFLGGNIGGVLAYSADGASWTRVINTAAPFGDMDCIAYGNGRFVAVGGDRMAYCDW